jgi:hypothetical protein
MNLRLLAPLVAIFFPLGSALAQLPSEFAALACKPTQHDSADLIIEKKGGEWSLSVQTSEAKRVILRATDPISNAQRASDVGYVVYFLVNPKYPKQSGWRLHRLSDGNSVQILEAQLPPISACITPDGRTLDYVTQLLGAVQIDLGPAYERFRYRDDPAPKDHVLVPKPDGG